MRATTLVLALALLSGCTTPVNPRVSDARTDLTGMAPLPVRAAPEMWNHADEFRSIGLPFRSETGHSFAKVFAGTGADMPTVEILASKLTSHIAKLGFAAELDYDVTIRLHQGEKATDLTAHAKHVPPMFQSLPTQVKIVTENAIADLARQVSAILYP
jgi:hypothetical protein